MIASNAPAEGAAVLRQERVFEFALPALVRGRDIRDRDFAEETRLASLSAQEATLRLRPQVRVGSRLVVTLSVPPTRLLGPPVRLALSGTVSRVAGESARTRNDRVITLRLDRNYRISSPAA
jgi:hypothetical protein